MKIDPQLHRLHDALMLMCYQYLRPAEKNDACHCFTHEWMCAGESALAALEEAGLACPTDKGRTYYDLDFKDLERRQRILDAEAPDPVPSGEA